MSKSQPSGRSPDEALGFRAGEEPIAGYRLVEPLGKGGFGEVWKCEAPGGFHKAVKFVRHADQAEDSSRPDLALKELKALELIRNIRHPFVLNVERVERVEDFLLIFMELAEGNLADVFRRNRDQGMAGIPRAQLLFWLEEAAEALDLINFDHGLQHLDVKPQNLMMVSNHLKVADFGLVNRVTRSDGKTRIGGLATTPRYAAPEILQGHISRQSDQYSLAIVYQELLTGEAPFKGRNARELFLQHLEAPPDLSSLSSPDRLHIARALSKDPGKRFHRCQDLMRALLRTGSSAEIHLPDLAFTEPTDSGAMPETALVGESYGTVSETSPGGSSVDLQDFRYLDRIGANPLGEFWEVQAPTEEKWVVHHLHGFAVEEGAAQWEALEGIQKLRHPSLMPFEIAEVSPNRIILAYTRWYPTLLEAVREKGLPIEKLLDYTAEVARALDDLVLRANLYHLALNPAAVHLGPDGILLRDFGLLSRLWLPGQPYHADFNPGFAAPETATSRPGRTADQYALARIFLEGILPELNHRDRRKESAVLLEGLKPAERRVLLRALDSDPDKRFTTCTEFVQALAQSMDDSRGTRTTDSATLHQAARLESLHCLQDWLDEQEGILPIPSNNPIVRSRTLPDGSMEERCFIRLLPNTSGLKLEVFRQEWNAALSCRGEDDYLLFLPLERNFWQKLTAQEAGIGLEVVFRPRESGEFGEMEMVATLQILGCNRKRADRIRAELAPIIFSDLRECLQAMTDRRRRPRIPFAGQVHVRPRERKDQEIVCTGKDLSHRGIGFQSPVALGGQVRLVFALPGLAEAILLDAWIIRCRELPEGGYEVGARFPVHETGYNA